VLAMRIVKPGGLVVFHDYHGLGKVDVRDVLDPLSEFIPLWRIDGTWFAVTRKMTASGVTQPKGLTYDAPTEVPDAAEAVVSNT
jgi:hypothetical protein